MLVSDLSVSVLYSYTISVIFFDKKTNPIHIGAPIIDSINVGFIFKNRQLVIKPPPNPRYIYTNVPNHNALPFKAIDGNY